MGIRTRLRSLFKPESSGIAHGSVVEGEMNPRRNPQCSEFEVDGWALSRFVSHKLVPIVDIHPFPLQELMLMTAAIAGQQPSLVFEWGTNIGKSARIFYEVALHYGVPTVIHSIDLPDDIEHVEHPRTDRGVMVRGIDAVHLHQGDGLTTSLQIWRQAGSPANPLFFIDGDHSYASVSRELQGIIESVPDPLLLLHDTFFQSPDSDYNIGRPHQAVAEFLERHPSRFQVLHSGISLPGMTLLMPKKHQ